MNPDHEEQHPLDQAFQQAAVEFSAGAIANILAVMSPEDREKIEQPVINVINDLANRVQDLMMNILQEIRQAQLQAGVAALDV